MDGKLPQQGQAATAAAIVQQVVDTYATSGEQVVVTGQSLGGYEGMYAANQQNNPNVSAVVFDAPALNQVFDARGEFLTLRGCFQRGAR